MSKENKTTTDNFLNTIEEREAIYSLAGIITNHDDVTCPDVPDSYKMIQKCDYCKAKRIYDYFKGIKCP